MNRHRPVRHRFLWLALALSACGDCDTPSNNASPPPPASSAGPATAPSSKTRPAPPRIQMSPAFNTPTPQPSST